MSPGPRWAKEVPKQERVSPWSYQVHDVTEKRPAKLISKEKQRKGQYTPVGCRHMKRGVSSSNRGVSSSNVRGVIPGNTGRGREVCSRPW
jgi:hypothetical protein